MHLIDDCCFSKQGLETFLWAIYTGKICSFVAGKDGRD